MSGIKILAQCALAVFVSSPSLSGQSADAILRKVDAHYNHLASLQARYTEHYVGMGMDRAESGTLLLQKPGRMRWSYDAPAGKVFILDGKSGWFYTPGDVQAQRVSAKKLDDLRSPLRLLLGHTQLQKELSQIEVASMGDGFRITGVPRGPERRAQSISLDVDSAGLIRRILLVDLDGARTSFEFSEMRENVAVGGAAFVFNKPAGVAVVEGMPPIQGFSDPIMRRAPSPTPRRQPYLRLRLRLDTSHP